MHLWIATALEDGLPVPEPRGEESYSGKFIVRVPKSLHNRLVERAEREEISLNQFVSTVLAGAVGFAVGNAPVSSQISRQEIRAMISETVKEVLKVER